MMIRLTCICAQKEKKNETFNLSLNYILGKKIFNII
jgi:hypothetical protein